MKDEPVLELKDLSIVYKTLADSVLAVKDANLTVAKKQALGVIGESGCGKSTLGYAIMKYLPSNGASSGEIIFNGEDLLPKTDREMNEYRGNRIAMVFQNPYSSLNPSLTIGYQLDEVTVRHRSYTKKQALKVLANIEKRIDKLITRCEQADAQEEGQPSFTKLSKDFEDANKLKSKIESIAERLKDKDVPSNINIIDSDCSRVHSRQGTHAGFNGQVVVDGKNGLIVNSDVVSENHDTDQLSSSCCGKQ